jgi:hypothetical protein
MERFCYLRYYSFLKDDLYNNATSFEMLVDLGL